MQSPGIEATMAHRDAMKRGLAADVHIDGSRAWGTRLHGPGSSDDVEFVRRKSQWYTKLISRRRP
jgi:hypothetical protein